MEPFVLDAFFFPIFIVIAVHFEASPCDEASCGLVRISLVLQAFGLVWGLGILHSKDTMF